MQQIILSDYEQNPILQDVAIPEPKDGEVLVRIAAAALNPLDVKLQRGEVHAYFPLTFRSPRSFVRMRSSRLPLPASGAAPAQENPNGLGGWLR